MNLDARIANSSKECVKMVKEGRPKCFSKKYQFLQNDLGMAHFEIQSSDCKFITAKSRDHIGISNRIGVPNGRFS